MLSLVYGEEKPAMEPQDNETKWLVNGFPARIKTWTAEEWLKLFDQPKSAQCQTNGLWVVLSID
jgi:hypothetical protein